MFVNFANFANLGMFAIFVFVCDLVEFLQLLRLLGMFADFVFSRILRILLILRFPPPRRSSESPHTIHTKSIANLARRAQISANSISQWKHCKTNSKSHHESPELSKSMFLTKSNMAMKAQMLYGFIFLMESIQDESQFGRPELTPLQTRFLKKTNASVCLATAALFWVGSQII